MSNNQPQKMSKAAREEYSKRIKSLRQSKGLKQEELAYLADVTRQTISNIENGTVPQQDKLVRILQVLGVDVAAQRFDDQTQLWLSMMGTLIEAVPPVRRAPTVDRAIRVLADGINPDEQGGIVTPLRPLPTNDGGYIDDAYTELDKAAGSDETQADED